MASMDIRIQRPLRLVIPRFSSEQTRQFAEKARQQIDTRLSNGMNVHDSPAKPLKPGYAKRKQRSGGSGIRDLKLTGAMLDAFQVESANPLSAEIGFTDDAQRLKASANEHFEDMVGFSPNDKETIMREEIEPAWRRNLKHAWR